MVHFRQITETRSHSYTYLLADTDRREAVMIDPAEGEVTLYLGLLDELQARLTHILLTHTHGAHAPGALELHGATGARLVWGEPCRIEGADACAADGTVIVFGDELIRCRATPGHTAGSLSYLWRDRVFTGDTLLIDDCGATGSGDGDPGSLFDSLTRTLLALPDETLVYPAHDFAGRRVTCIGEQRHTNTKLRGTTRDEFILKQSAGAQAALAP